MIIKIDLSKYKMCPACQKLYSKELGYNYCPNCAKKTELCDVESHDSH